MAQVILSYYKDGFVLPTYQKNDTWVPHATYSTEDGNAGLEVFGIRNVEFLSYVS